MYILCMAAYILENHVGGEQTLSGLLEGLSKIVLAASTLSAEKQTLVVPVGNLTTFARSVSLSCDAASSP